MRHDQPRFKGLTTAEGQIDAFNTRIINLGAPVLGSDAARLQDIGASFYPLTVKHTDDTQVIRNVSVISFAVDDFYVTSNPTNPDEAVINLRNPINNIFHSQDFASSPEWIVNHSLDVFDLVWAAYDESQQAIIPEIVDISDPNTAFFYFGENVAGRVVLSGAGGKDQGPTGDTGPEGPQGIAGAGFYIIVKETEADGFSSKADTIAFDSDKFYVSAGGDGKPIVSAPDLIDDISIIVESPDVKEYRLNESAAFRYEIIDVTHKLVLGGATGGFYINNVSVVGMDPVFFYPQRAINTAGGANIVEAGDTLKLSIFEDLASTDLSFSMKIRRL